MVGELDQALEKNEAAARLLRDSGLPLVWLGAVNHVARRDRRHVRRLGGCRGCAPQALLRSSTRLAIKAICRPPQASLAASARGTGTARGSRTLRADLPRGRGVRMTLRRNPLPNRFGRWCSPHGATSTERSSPHGALSRPPRTATCSSPSASSTSPCPGSLRRGPRPPRPSKQLGRRSRSSCARGSSCRRQSRSVPR